MTGQIRSALKSVVAPEALLSEEASEQWRTGEGEEGLPGAVLAPSSEEETAGILAMASREGWRVLPAGLGTWLQGGGASDVDLVVTTQRMRTVQEYEPADLTFTAGAGLSLAALRGLTEPHRQWLPLDPPGGLGGSLGASVALGIGGPLRHLYGTPRDHVLGITMVSGDGRVLRWGGRVVKNVAGFDVTRLAVGSWGTLGVVTSVSARLFPIPEGDVTLIVQRPTVVELAPLARAMARSSLPMAEVELVGPLGALPDAGGQALPEDKWGKRSPALVLRLLGTQAQVAEMEARARADLGGGGGPLIRMAGAESAVFHRELSGWETGADLVLRLCLLPSKLGTLLDEAEELRALLNDGSPERGAGGGFRVSAHVGVGVLRVAVSGWETREGALGRWASALRGLRDRLEKMGGSLTVSVGPGALVREVGSWGAPGGEHRLMTGLKSQFDPKSVLAPGRLGL